MSPRYGSSVRILGLALLVLTVSPVTAPFPTVDLVGLFGDATARGASSIQSKKAPEEPVSALDGPAALIGPDGSWTRLTPRTRRGADRRPAFDPPLRL